MVNRKVSIITDCGLDDILAIFYLYQNNSIEIENIFVVDSFFTNEESLSIFEAVIPELVKKVFFVDEFRRKNDEDFFDFMKPKDLPSSNTRAIIVSDEELCRALSDSVLVLSPPHDLFAPLVIENGYAKSKFYILGGCIENGIGNFNFSCEYNFARAPLGANRLMNHFDASVMVLDCSSRVKFKIGFFEQLENTVLVGWIRLYEKKYYKLGADYILLHDLVLAVYFCNASYFMEMKRFARVNETDALEFRGLLCIDEHRFERSRPNTNFIYKCHQDGVLYEILKTII